LSKFPKAKPQVGEIEKLYLRGDEAGRWGACWHKVTFALDFELITL